MNAIVGQAGVRVGRRCGPAVSHCSGHRGRCDLAQRRQLSFVSASRPVVAMVRDDRQRSRMGQRILGDSQGRLDLGR